MQLSLNLAPKQVITISALIAAAALGVALWLATQAPSLGATFRTDEQGLIVDQVWRGAADNPLQPGQKIVAIRDSSGRSLPLAPVDVTPEPDMKFMQYSDMDAFFQRQSARHAALAQASVQLTTETGAITVTPRPHRPLTSLPFVFWFQLFCGVTGLLAGASVWAYRRHDPATKYYAFTGVGLMLSACSAAI